MDSTIIIATIIVLSLAILIAVFVQTAKNKRQQLEKRLQQKAMAFELTNQTKLGRQDIFNNKLIGIDTSGSTLLFLEEQDHGIEEIKVDLADITGAQIMVSTAKSEFPVLFNKLDENTVAFSLHLHPRNGASITLPFYREMLDGPAECNEILGLAKEWSNLILENNKTSFNNKSYV